MDINAGRKGKSTPKNKEEMKEKHRRREQAKNGDKQIIKTVRKQIKIQIRTDKSQAESYLKYLRELDKHGSTKTVRGNAEEGKKD